jgi:predicted ester cyclase
MRAAANTEVLRRWIDDLWNRRRDETIDELLLPDAIGHAEHLVFRGPSEFKPLHTMFLKAFPDLGITIDSCVAEGDQVVGRWSGRATFTGEFMGLPPTHEEVELCGTTWARIARGRIAELWVSWNLSYLLRKLLEQTLAEVEVLRGILPICSHCKKIRSDDGYWEQVDSYISKHSPTEFTHSICPGCLNEHYSEFVDTPGE